jgi:hypothetical protein
MTPSLSQIAALPESSTMSSSVSQSAILSCYAATELDRLLLKGDSTLENVNAFISFMETQVAGHGIEQNPETIMALSWAFEDCDLLHPSVDTTIEQLFDEAAKISRYLKDVMQRPNHYLSNDRFQLQSLRDFCLSLSKRFASSEASFSFEDPIQTESP